MNKINDRIRAKLHADHVRGICELLAAIEAHGIDNGDDASWGDLPEIAAAHMRMVEAAYHLGAITIEQAKTNHGATL